MQRHEMMTAMAELGLKGMAGAFDEAVTTGLQRKRTTMEVLTDLLRAEAAHRHQLAVLDDALQRLGRAGQAALFVDRADGAQVPQFQMHGEAGSC